MGFIARLFLVAGFLFATMLCSGATAQAQIVAIGASNVAGKGVSSSDAWPAQLEGMLAAKGRNVHVTNAGISGDTNAGMLARLDSAVPEGTKIVLLDQYGGGRAKEPCRGALPPGRSRYLYRYDRREATRNGSATGLLVTLIFPDGRRFDVKNTDTGAAGGQ